MFSTHFPPVATSYPLSFQSTAASCAPSKKPSPLESSKSSLFWQNTRGGVPPQKRPFGINNFQPLSCAPVCNLVTTGAKRTLIRPSARVSVPSISPATHYSLPTTHLFSSSFVFMTIGVAFPQLLYFHHHPHCPGGGGQPSAFDALHFFSKHFASCGKEEC